MANHPIAITKRQGADDFPRWKRRIMALPRDKDHDVTINYHVKTSDPLEDAPGTSSPDKCRMDLHAKHLIELNVGDCVLQRVCEETPHAHGTKRHALCQRQSLSSIVCGVRSVLTCTQAGRPTQEYVGLVEQRARDLKVRVSIDRINTLSLSSCSIWMVVWLVWRPHSIPKKSVRARSQRAQPYS